MFYRKDVMQEHHRRHGVGEPGSFLNTVLFHLYNVCDTHIIMTFSFLILQLNVLV